MSYQWCSQPPHNYAKFLAQGFVCVCVCMNVTCDLLLTRPKTFVLPWPDSAVAGVGCHQTFRLVFVSLECIPHIFSQGLEMKLVICGGYRA